MPRPDDVGSMPNQVTGTTPVVAPVSNAGRFLQEAEERRKRPAEEEVRTLAYGPPASIAAPQVLDQFRATSDVIPTPTLQMNPYGPPTLTAGSASSGLSAPNTASGPEDQDRIKMELALGSNKQGPVLQTPERPQDVGVGEVKRMTWEAYQALDPKQKAAVDFNTMLVGAVRKDLRNQDRYEKSATEVEREAYDVAVSEMFGATGGSEIFAPETMAVLQQIDYQTPNTDLDDFLGLNAAITRKDIRQLPNVSPLDTSLYREQVEPTVEQTRLDLANGLAMQTQKMEEALAEGNQMLNNFPQIAAQLRTEDVGYLGGVKTPMPTPMGYGEIKLTEAGTPADVGSYMALSYASLQKPDVDSAKVIEEARKVLTGPGEFEYYEKYIRDRLSLASRYDSPPAPDLKPEEYRKPEVVLNELQLGGVGNGRPAPTQ